MYKPLHAMPNGTMLVLSIQVSVHCIKIQYICIKFIVLTDTYQTEWSVPAKMLRPLLEALQSDLSAAGIEWNGDSETLKEYLQANQIDPKVDSRFRRFYVNTRHTASVSYTWRGTSLFEIADTADLPENLNELVWIDVLVVSQFSISSSDQVVGTTDGIYRNCKVWVFLDNEYLGRAWCLAETGQYTNPESGCAVTVYGQAELKPGTDFLGSMDAGAKHDLPLIEKYILGKYKSKEAFNHAIDCAVLRLSPLSLIYQGRYDEALLASEQEIGMLQASECKESTVMVKAKATLGTVLGNLGQYERAMETLNAALKLCGESELELLGDITNGMGTLFLDMGQYTDAIQMLTESLDFRIRCFGTGHVSVAQTYNNMGVVEEKLGNFQNALDLYEKALEIKRQSLGGAHVSVAATYNNMGLVFQNLGDYEKALFYYQNALEIKIQSLGGAHVSVADTYNNMGVVEEKLGNFQNALDLYEKALEIKIQSHDGAHVSVADTYNNMGIVFQNLGDYEKALFHYQNALDVKIKSLGGAHVSAAATYNNMGLVEEKLGNFQNALDLYEKALEINIKSLGGAHVSVASTEMNIGNVLSAQGDYEKALYHFQNALEIFQESLGDSHVSVADTMYNMAFLYKRQGATAQAKRLFGEAGSIYSDAYGADHSKTLEALGQAQAAAPVSCIVA